MKNIILTSGGSQLLTQIATIKYLGWSNSEIEVYYTGIYTTYLERFLNDTCKRFGMVYKGCISQNLTLKPIKIRHLFYPTTLSRLFFSKNLTNELLKQLPLIADLQGAKVIITFRNKVKEDALLLTAIHPSSVTITADGVIDNPIQRFYNNWRWRGVNSPINQIPVKGKIYCPSYLTEDTKLVGTPEIIPDPILLDCFEQAKKLPICKGLLEAFEQINPKSILFSQHLALINSCSESIELKYYKDIVTHLVEQGQYPILIKPHPRDTKIKFDLLKDFINLHTNKVFILSEQASAIPIEVMTSYLKSKEINLVTASSSAPLSLVGNKSKFYNYLTEYLPPPLKEEIKNFANRYKGILQSI